ncbi:MAG TPA: hypothetical protein VLK33_17425, partial [Terriglobales bacterium]|nr:hypothetical protein [Terriglobales bacterium]
MTIHRTINNEKGVATIAADLKSELVEFVQTRFQMLKEETREKSARLKIALPLMGLALVMIVTAYLLITMTLVSVVVALLEG